MPIEGEVHKDLHQFKSHFAQFTSLFEIARSKGLGENPEFNFARVNKVVGGVHAFLIRTQDAWQHEFPSLVDGISLCNLVILPKNVT